MSLAVSAGGWRVTGVVAFALFMDFFIYGLVVPLTLYSPAQITGEEQFGMLYGVYALGVLTATPLFGYFGARIGLRRAMICGVAASAAAMMLFWLAPSFPLLLLARLLEGVSASAAWTAGMALIATHHTERRLEMMGYALMGSTAGSVLGPVAGGLLYQVGGYSLPFLVTLAMVAIDAVLRVFVLPADRTVHELPTHIGTLLLDRSIFAAAMAVALAAIGWGIVEPLLPSELERAGAGPATIGLIFTIATIAYGVVTPAVAWVSQHMAIRKVIAGGTLAMAFALPLLSVLHGEIGVAVALCLVSMCYAFMMNGTSGELGDAVDRHGMTCYSVVYAVYNVAYAAGQTAANAFASTAAARLGFLQILLCVSAALILATPLMLRRPAPAAALQPAVSK